MVRYGVICHDKISACIGARCPAMVLRWDGCTWPRPWIRVSPIWRTGSQSHSFWHAWSALWDLDRLRDLSLARLPLHKMTAQLLYACKYMLFYFWKGKLACLDSEPDTVSDSSTPSSPPFFPVRTVIEFITIYYFKCIVLVSKMKEK